MKIKQELQQHITDHYLKGKASTQLDDEYNLIDNGVLDSLAILNLVAHVEMTYRIEFGENDIVPEHLESIQMLADFIERKLNQKELEHEN